MKTTMQRFIEKVDVKGEHDCWEWLASRNKDGYGRFRMGAIKTTAHRVAYELFKGLIPAGLFVLHSCDNPSCVNPGHLRVGTVVDNSADMVDRGRSIKGRTVSNRRSYKGEGSPNAKISKEDAIKILGDSRAHKVIAAEYGVTRAAISHLKRGFTWGHLQE